MRSSIKSFALGLLLFGGVGGSTYCLAALVEPPELKSAQPSHWGDEAYLGPNELVDYLYAAPTSELKGAVITVGTIRSFQRVLYGNFDWVFMVDLENAASTFNKYLYQLIQNSDSNVDFLLRFYGKRADAAAKKKLEAAIERGQIPKVIRRIGRLPKRESGAVSKTEGEFYAFMSEGDRYSKFNAAFGYFSTPDPDHLISFGKKFFFMSNESFATLKQKLSAANVVILNESINSEGFREKASQFLKHRNIKVGLLGRPQPPKRRLRDREDPPRFSGQLALGAERTSIFDGAQFIRPSRPIQSATHRAFLRECRSGRLLLHE